jgi:hypothetical protein
VQAKIFIKILYVLGHLPPSIKDSCSIPMLNVLLESLPGAVEGTCVSGCDDVALYVRDIVTVIGVLGNGEPLQVFSRKLLECVVISDGHR